MRHPVLRFLVAAAVSAVCCASDAGWTPPPKPPAGKAKAREARCKKVTAGAKVREQFMPVGKGLEDMKKRLTLGCVYFYNPAKRSDCYQWERRVFGKAAKELAGLEKDVTFIALNTGDAKDLPTDKKVARQWRRWAGRRGRGSTYVRLLYFDGSPCRRISKAPRDADHLIREIKRAAKRNELRAKRWQALEEKRKAAEGKKGKGDKAEGGKPEAKAAEGKGEKSRAGSEEKGAKAGGGAAGDQEGGGETVVE